MWSFFLTFSDISLCLVFLCAVPVEVLRFLDPWQEEWDDGGEGDAAEGEHVELPEVQDAVGEQQLGQNAGHETAKEEGNPEETRDNTACGLVDTGQNMPQWMAVQPFLLFSSFFKIKNGWAVIYRGTFCL